MSKFLKILWISIGVLALATKLMTVQTLNAASPFDAKPNTQLSSPTPTFSYVTSYSSVESCHYAGCITATGKPAYIGGIACPRKLTLGTKVIIQGKIYTCNDRTSKKYDGRYDIFQGYGESAHTRALQWGIKKLEVKILK